MSEHTISECLATLEVSVQGLEACESLDAEFAFIKKTYFKKVLVCHPDKGGDAAVFRPIQTSFEALRDFYDNGRIEGSFLSSGDTTMNDEEWQDFCDMPTQSYEYFYEAAEEAVPSYCVELAKSGRSACKQKSKIGNKCGEDKIIPKGSVRCGSLDDQSGGYGRWHHLACWRVPSKVWLGLPNPAECEDAEMFARALLGMTEVTLTGFSALPDDDKDAFVEHVMDKGNWARLQKKKAVAVPPPPASAAAARAAADSKALVPEGYEHANKEREHFVVPVPGNGAVAGALDGQTCVLTGLFPEVGGGTGLNLGRAKVQAMIERFGGRVTGSVSGKTDLLIVGKEPGAAKVSKAQAAKKCKLITLMDLKEIFEGASIDEVASKPVYIKGFSAGYGGGSAITTSEVTVIKNNIEPKSLEDDGETKPAAKKRKGAKGAKKPAAKKKKAATKKGAKKTSRKAKAMEEKENASDDEGNVSMGEESDGEDETSGYKITCDLCQARCTEQSWYNADTEEDYCVDCYDGRGVEQYKGVNV